VQKINWAAGFVSPTLESFPERSQDMKSITLFLPVCQGKSGMRLGFGVVIQLCGALALLLTGFGS
jgi:hypothetical protein